MADKILLKYWRLLVPLSFILMVVTGCRKLSATPTPIPTMTATTAPGQVRFDLQGVEQVWAPAGSFLMGSNDATIEKLKAHQLLLGEYASEQPQHEVHLTHGFWIDKYEVTNQAFMMFANAGGYQTQSYWSDAGWEWLSDQPFTTLPRYCLLGNLPNYPALCVTWYEAEAYAHWRGGRLPTEAEWEYAARGPQSLLYPWGNEFDDTRCNVVGVKSPTAVGSFSKCVSWVGAYDMAGNAMEWVQDWYAMDYYQHSPADDPTGPASGNLKIEKGGWWGSDMFVAHSANHHFDPPDYGDTDIGFRIVMP